MKTASTEPIDVASEKSQALALRPETYQQPTTAAQAKTDAIAQLTMKAYDRASTLVMTAEEITALAADFPDEAFKPGAAGKEHLIYIEHAFLRDRLNSVFGPGQWSLIPRNRWGEDFTTHKGTPGTRIYVEAMLLIRGCFVSEAVGSMEYYPKNESQDYGDAVEGAKTAALRRCCKELGVGLQAWKKDWGDGWWARKNGSRNSNTRGLNTLSRRDNDSDAAASSQQTVTPARTVEPAKQSKRATPVTRQWLLDTFAAGTGQVNHGKFLEYCCKAKMLTGTQTVEDLPLCYVPSDKRQMDLWGAAFNGFVAGEDAAIPFKNPDPQPTTTKPEPPPKPNGATVPRDQGVGEWRSFPVPFGKNAGKQLGTLDNNQLAAYARMMDEECESDTYLDKATGETRRKSAKSIAANKRFKAMLDAWRAEVGAEQEEAA